MENPTNRAVQEAGSVEELIRLVMRLHKQRTVVAFGVTKREGVSLQRERRSANDNAIALLNSLPQGFDGNKLTDEQRRVLAGYSGEGGLEGSGGSQYEYYTPPFMAEGIWDLFSDYGITSGHMLEPSAGTGVFQETKPAGAMMTSAEISDTSGRINQLLHPEDDVRLGAFEKLAASVPDNSYDHAVGNVPFGDSRTGFAELDPAYRDETNVGHYFVMRTIDKVKYGGLVVLVVPNGMTDGGGNNKKLRDRVSRVAEFLGAHRMPSGTFAESGTATVVDVWVLRKHTEALTQLVHDSDEQSLEAASVLWPTFIRGKWFETEGRRFVHGETERSDFNNILVVKKDGQLTNEAMKAALSRRFDSRIDWDRLGTPAAVWQSPVEGDKRLMAGVWHTYDGTRFIKDATTASSGIDAARFGAATFGDLQTKTRTINGMLSLDSRELYAASVEYPQLFDDRTHAAIRFAMQQKPGHRWRVMRASIIGLRINDALNTQMLGGDASGIIADAARLVSEEVGQYGTPKGLKLAGLSDASAKGWLSFQANVSREGDLSALLNGTIDRSEAAAVDFASPEQVVSHLFSDVDLVPVALSAFRAAFTGQLPEDDEALLAHLATFPEIALDGNGNIMPLARATSGNVRGKVSRLAGLIDDTPDGPVKANYVRQLEAINEKRKHTSIEDITVNLNARWLDRRLIKEFLIEQGFDDFKYTQDLENDNGYLTSEDNYAGKDGVFSGYQVRSVTSKGGVTEFKRASYKDGFYNQLENYLNGVKPRGVNANAYLKRISDLESHFNDWLRTHPDVETVVSDYNDAFNGYVPFEHSSSSLQLQQISGKRIPLSYQNAEVRRLSEDGRGIMGFGTGLGKTTTALALEAYNYEVGRSKRTVYVVPKAVLQNWYHEAQGFYSAEAFQNILFVGLDEVRGEDGQIMQAQERDENNEPKLDKDGQPVMRNVVKESAAATVLERMNMIPVSNYRAVVMTKEQFGDIPMRPETIEENSSQAVFNQIENGRTDLMKSTHRAATSRNKLRDKAADTGTKKKSQIPYFEDMHFDSVIADEGHNYRNSHSAGREAGQLAYLPNPSVSKIARDMAVKSQYMMKKYNGRGVVMLTATPLVNSPIDAFNMLSHVVSLDEWKAMGILTPDDFVRVFGETESVTVQKISGELEDKQGLVGFKNLDGLRGIFHRWTTLKSAADVKDSVKIPGLDEKTVGVPMTRDQKELYEELRVRASRIGQKETVQDNGDGTMSIVQNDDDFIFSVIRDMDKVVIDPDLYRSAITFRFREEDLELAKQVARALPGEAGGQLLAGDEEETAEDAETGLTDTRTSKVVKTTLKNRGGVVELVVSDTLEQQVLAAIASAGISMENVSHPVPPKYAALIENLKAGLPDGKQIIFMDEKSQHNKLRRIIASALGLTEQQVGIINATTVSKASGVKVKPVKKPVEPVEKADGSFKDGSWDKYYEELARYEDYQAALSDASLAGMEGIAADYNEGRTPIIICNKKAEVGINLHKGTADTHHLTLPWTPASIDQRNGRGARVGSERDTMRVHYYCGKGSFDEFRLETLQRKKNWINDVMKSDVSSIKNGDVESKEEQSLLLAANPEERRARVDAQLKAKREADRQQAEREAAAALDIYLKASVAAATPVEVLEGNITKLSAAFDAINGEIDGLREDVTDAEAAYNRELERDGKRSADAWRGQDRRVARAALREGLAKQKKLEQELGGARKALTRSKSAASTIKRSRGEVERAIKSGALEVDPDVLRAPEQYMKLPDGQLVRIGATYEIWLNDDREEKGVFQIRKFFPEKNTVEVELIHKPLRCYTGPNVGGFAEMPSALVGDRVDITSDQAKALQTAAKGIEPVNLADTLSRADFYAAIHAGVLNVNTDGWLYRDNDGRLKLAYLRGTISASEERPAETWLYPDHTDEQLKRELYQYSVDNNIYSAQGFFKAMFGRNYDTALQAYGKQAGMADVVKVFNRLVAEFEANDPKKRSVTGANDEEAHAAFLDSAQDRYYWSNVISLRQFRNGMEGFSNRHEYEAMFEHLRNEMADGKVQAVKSLTEQYAAAALQQFRQMSESDSQAGIAVLLVKSKFDAYSDIDRAATVTESPAAIYLRAGVSLGALDDAGITVETFASSNAIKRQLTMVYLWLDRMEKGDYREYATTWDDYKALMIGKLSPEDVKARREAASQRAVAAAATVRTVQVQKQADGFQVMKNEQELVASRKWMNRTFKIDFPAGGAYVLMDTSDKPVLKRKAVRDLIKEKYGAKFWNFEENPVAGNEFTQAAWLIPSSHDLDALRNDIVNA